MSDIIDPSSIENWVKLVSKFNNKCCICGTNIQIGTECFWQQGRGVKCINACNPPQIPQIITQDEWNDFQKYSWKFLQTIEKCQRCGNILRESNEHYFNESKRVCYKCF